MRGIGMSFGHMNGILALIALALGYMVCLLANKEKDLLKRAGYIIGIAIIAISSVIILSKVLVTAKMFIRFCPMQESSVTMTPAASPSSRK